MDYVRGLKKRKEDLGYCTYCPIRDQVPAMIGKKICKNHSNFLRERTRMAAKGVILSQRDYFESIGIIKKAPSKKNRYSSRNSIAIDARNKEESEFEKQLKRGEKGLLPESERKYRKFEPVEYNGNFL